MCLLKNAANEPINTICWFLLVSLEWFYRNITLKYFSANPNDVKIPCQVINPSILKRLHDVLLFILYSSSSVNDSFFVFQFLFKSTFLSIFVCEHLHLLKWFNYSDILHKKSFFSLYWYNTYLGWPCFILLFITTIVV